MVIQPYIPSWTTISVSTSLNSYWNVRKLETRVDSLGKHIFPTILSSHLRRIPELIVPLYLCVMKIMFSLANKRTFYEFSTMMDSQKLYLVVERFQLFSFLRDRGFHFNHFYSISLEKWIFLFCLHSRCFYGGRWDWRIIFTRLTS